MSVVAVREKPILFSGSMIRAILNDDHPKTQTRRVVKNTLGVCDRCFAEAVPRNIESLATPDGRPNIAGGFFGTDPYLRVAFCGHNDACGGRLRCPYGAVGDALWVREAAYICPPNWSDPGDANCRDSQGRPRVVAWAADMNWDGVRIAEDDYGLRKSPSIHMPRWASRITLKLTGVRVERLTRISPEDALAEGIESYAREHGLAGYWTTAFARLWDDINAKRGCPWASDPWCWVLEFRRIEP